MRNRKRSKSNPSIDKAKRDEIATPLDSMIEENRRKIIEQGLRIAESIIAKYGDEANTETATEKAEKLYTIEAVLPRIGWKMDSVSFLEWLRSNGYLTKKGLPTEKSKKFDFLRVEECWEFDNRVSSTYITRLLLFTSVGIVHFNSKINAESL